MSFSHTSPDAPARSLPARRLRRFLSAAVFAGLVAVISLAFVPYGAVDPWWAAVFQAAVFALAALWAVEGAVGGDWVSREQLVAAPLALLALYALVQSWTVSFDPYETRLAAAQLAALALALALLVRYASSERRLRVLVYTVVAVGAASALFGILRQASQHEALGYLLARLPRGSGYAQFINKNHFAYLAEMALGLLWGVAAGGGVPRRKLLVPVAVALPVWAALVLSNSRGGLFAMLCQVIFLAATFGAAHGWRVPEAGRRGHAVRERAAVERIARSKVARGALALALLATIVVGMVWLGGDSLADRVASVGEEAVSAGGVDSTRTGRKDIWAAAWEMFEDNPLTGVGIGGFWIAVSRYHRGSGESVPQQAHNDYLEALASGGVVGASAVALFLLLFLRLSASRLREGTPFSRAACLGALTGLLGVAVHSLVDFGLHVPANAYAAVALVAIATVRINGQKTSHNEY